MGLLDLKLGSSQGSHATFSSCSMNGSIMISSRCGAGNKIINNITIGVDPEIQTHIRGLWFYALECEQAFWGWRSGSTNREMKSKF